MCKWLKKGLLLLLAGSTLALVSGCGGGGGDSGALPNNNPPNNPPTNNAPVAGGDTAAVSEFAEVTIDVLANDSDTDGDALTVGSLTAPTNGSVVNNGDGTVNYIPDIGITGTDFFDYTVSDGRGGTSTATVTIDTALAPMGRTSIASDESQATGGSSFSTSLSSEGRFVAFESDADNLVSGDTNLSADIFVRDRWLGSTERVSISDIGSGGLEGDNDSGSPAISDDGRFVAFESDAENLVPGDTNLLTDVFVHDRQTGTTERVSVDSTGAETNFDSFNPAISADGRFVAFESDDTNLVAGDTNNARDIFVHDRQTGTTERVSVDSAGAQADLASFSPAISADGRFVAFDSNATTLVGVSGDTNSVRDIFVHDRQSGTTERASVSSAGAQTGFPSFNPAISADGRYVVFDSDATNLVAGDANVGSDVYVRDRQAGTTGLVSLASDGTQAENNSFNVNPAISADGRFVVFDSDAANLAGTGVDTNNSIDVFMRDTQPATAATERLNAAPGGVSGNNDSELASISSDGRYVGFESLASSLVDADTNVLGDAFVAPNSF